MKWFFTFLLFVFYFSVGYSQVTWDTKINYETTDLLDTNPGLLKTQDGNYLFLYWRSDNPPIQNNSLTHALAKYNTSGELLWEKTYDQWEYTTPGSNSNQPYGMVEMPNGNILIAGRVFGGPPSYSDAVLYLISSDGDSLLFRSYPEYDLFRKITVQYNNTISVVGYNSNNNNKFFILKINATTGDIIEVNPTTHIAIGGESFFPKNSNYYVHFTTSSDSIQLKKYSLSNDLLLSNAFPYPEGFGLGNSFLSGVAYNQSSNDDKIVIYNSALLEFDENLNPTLQVPFSTSSLSPSSIVNWHESMVIIPTSDGGYIMSGTRTPSGDFYTATVFFIKVNAQGNEEWGQSFSNWELPANYITDMIEEPDGYVFIRHAFFDGEIYLTKMTKTGQLVPTNNLEPEIPINIYPNPFFEYFNLDISKKLEKGILHIYNAQGQLIYIKENLQRGNNEIQLNVKQTGIYFIKIMDESGREILTKKIIHQ